MLRTALHWYFKILRPTGNHLQADQLGGVSLGKEQVEQGALQKEETDWGGPLH